MMLCWCLVHPLLVHLLLVTSWLVAADRPREANPDVQHQECTASRRGDGGECAAGASPPPSSVYVIGDLHGDAICAVSWVNRTGLIANLIGKESNIPVHMRLNKPSTWKWTDEDSKLVFMGDYVDKGPMSKQTVEFVKDLTEAFPEKVTAICGNHEMELLRDRDVNTPYERYSAYSYATVHPGEYHNYFDEPRRTNDGAGEDGSDGGDPAPGTRALDEKDDLVLDLLYEAGMEVYTHNAHSVVRFVPSLPEHTDAHRKRGIMYAITDLMPPQHRPLARERLAEYTEAYLNAFRTGSALGDWVERRPIVHLAEGINTLFVHGGVSHSVGKLHLSRGREDVDRLNALWWEHSSEVNDFLGEGMPGNDVMGSAIYSLLTTRSNHPGYSKWESHGTFEDVPTDQDEVCSTLRDMLSHMEGIDRIAVGHTPEFNVRIMCDGAFLALDSTLGRWIRGSGNEYCPGPEHFVKRRGVDVPRTSRDGKYRCEEIKEVCEGQIVRLDSDGSVNVLTM